MLGVTFNFPSLLLGDELLSFLFLVAEIKFEIVKVLFKWLDITLLWGHVLSLSSKFLASEFQSI